MLGTQDHCAPTFNGGKRILTKPRLIAVILAFLSSSCSIPTKTLTCDLEVLQSEQTAPTSVSSAIHIDGSGSMLGYVNPKIANSRYVQTIELLYNTFTLIPAERNMPESTFHRSDASDRPISASQFRKAKRPEFYDGSNPSFRGINSALDESIVRQTVDTGSQSREDQLLVLVTDLNMDEGDNTKLLKKIQDTYFGRKYPGYAVGILGIKSEFEGTVYPVDGGAPFLYPNTSTDGNLRPFYVLIMGPYSEVRFYLEKLRADGEEFLKDSEVSLYYPEVVVEKLAHLGLPQEDIRQPKSLNDGNVVLVEQDPNKSELFEFSSSEGPKSITYQVPFVSLPFSLAINHQDLDFRYDIEYFDPIEKKFKDQNDSGNLQKALQLKDVAFESDSEETGNNTMILTAEINPEFLNENPGIYKFTINAIAQDYRQEEWWKEWSWDLQNDSATDGSKTRGLLLFLKNLKNTAARVTQEKQPMIGRFCFGIQKN